MRTGDRNVITYSKNEKLRTSERYVRKGENKWEQMRKGEKYEDNEKGERR